MSDVADRIGNVTRQRYEQLVTGWWAVTVLSAQPEANRYRRQVDGCIGCWVDSLSHLMVALLGQPSAGRPLSTGPVAEAVLIPRGGRADAGRATSAGVCAVESLSLLRKCPGDGRAR
ncbi:hypothetical protein OG604_14715 [Streptomyces sp. NBC_01231]|nr:hypothetical protein OG604_14715 [Streptomyces sp. NBC_01231]